MSHYSFYSLVKNAFSNHRKWQQAWRSPTLKPKYDVVIIGAGGQGLATAYYLAKHHGAKNIAVLDKGWVGGGNTGRNTATIRSNYFYKASADFYDHSLKQYQLLGKELNYNIMASQPGVLTLAHNVHDVELLQRRVNALHLHGVDAHMLTADEVKNYMPALNVSTQSRYPIVAGYLHKPGGMARHDAVAWGYARAADKLGVSIIQNCEVTDINLSNGHIVGVETSQGSIRTGQVAMTVAGHTSVLAKLAGFKIPIVSWPLQAMVSEPVKPVLTGVVVSPTVHAYVGQSDRGEILIGGGADFYTSYGQRGNIPSLEHTLSAVVEMFPQFRRLKLMRQWAGIIDISPDASPIIGKTPVNGLYISTGWGTGGFKGIPAGGETLAYTIAHDRPHPLIEPFGLDRFTTGALLSEGASSGVAQ